MLLIFAMKITEFVDIVIIKAHVQKMQLILKIICITAKDMQIKIKLLLFLI